MGLRVLTDPTFDPPGRLHRRSHFDETHGPCPEAATIGRVDAVLLSHDQHIDNLNHGDGTSLLLPGIVWTTHAGAQRLGKNANGLAPWKSTQLRSPGGRIFQITATPARHGPVGIEPIAGEVIGFVISTENGGQLVYVTGGTVWYDGVAEVAKRFPVKWWCYLPGRDRLADLFI